MTSPEEPKKNRPDSPKGVHTAAHPSFLSQYALGLSYHGRGLSFLLKNLILAKYLIIPVILSLSLYGVAFYTFTQYSTDIINWFFPQPQTGWFMLGVWYVTAVFLYIIVLAITVLTFLVVTNIICSPFYDLLVTQIIHLKNHPTTPPNTTSVVESFKEIGRLAIEELKKALFVALIPLALLLVPVIGTVLSAVAATLFITWEYADFTISRHTIYLKQRLAIVFENKFYFLGFGTLLMIPIVNLFLFPFAILGATLMTLERTQPSQEA